MTRPLFVGFLLLTAGLHAQSIRFVPFAGEDPLLLGAPFKLPDGTTVTLSAFRFYVGQFAFYTGGGVTSRNDAYHLIDAEDSSSFVVVLDDIRASVGDSLVFTLGVDSLTSVSGAFGGDLDPLKGMYWAWNSGYINLKLEGSSPVSPYPRRDFELHLGGYLPPHAAQQRVALPVQGSAPFTVKVDVLPLLVEADVRTRCNVMSPSERAVRLSQVAASSFHIHALH